MKRRQRRQRDARRKAHAEQGRDSEGLWLDDNQVLPLRWRPLYLDQLDSMKGATWVWPVIHEACGLSDPAQFPTFETAWTTDQAAMLARYVEMSERLIGTAVMN